MTQTYVKKRIPVRAEKFDAEHLRHSWDTLKSFTGGLVKNISAEDDGDWEVYYVFDYLHNSWIEFRPGDWVIKGIRGEFYPCAGDVFEETYEEYNDE